MELPDNIRYLIEALRNKGSDDNQTPRVIQRRNPDGSVVKVGYPHQGSTMKGMMPTGLRGKQIEGQLKSMGE